MPFKILLTVSPTLVSMAVPPLLTPSPPGFQNSTGFFSCKEIFTRFYSILLFSHSYAELAEILKEFVSVGYIFLQLTFVLTITHFVPSDDPSLTDEMWIEGARTHFEGKVIVGKDLMEI
jgi:hypothetical protein